MSYLRKLSLVALLTFYSATFSTATDLDSDDDPFDPFGQAAISAETLVKYTYNPDEIYERVLTQGNADKTAWIIDVDGTITNEEDPSKLCKDQHVTQKGKSADNIKQLIKEGAVVVLCSAWKPFHQTIERLTKVGFGNSELGTNTETTELKSITLTTPNNAKVNLQYHQSGHAISAKISKSNDYYFRNKAFSLMLISPDQLEGIEEIYFLDDSFKNHQGFISNVTDFGLYPGKKIHYYQVIPFAEKTPPSSS